jgi:GNAT superfamily N-acetyltransferase
LPSWTDVTVRRGAASDAGAVAGVHVRAWQVGYRGLIDARFLAGLSAERRAQQWREWLDAPGPGATILVAEHAGAVVGFASLGPSRDSDAGPPVGELYAIYVDPDAWGRGVGRALMAGALERLAGAGHAAARVWVLESNARARRFYEAGGWVADGERRQEEVARGATGEDGRGVTVPEVRYARPLARP